MSPNRLQNENRKWVVRFLTARDGYHCIHCGLRPAPDSPPLQIDHSNGNENDWRPENIHLTCQKCNLEFRKLTPAEHVKVIVQDSAKNVWGSDKNTVGAVLFQNRIHNDNVPIEIEVNSYCQQVFEKWLDDKLNRDGIVTRFDAIYGGAWVARCSPKTTERYLNMLISSEGPYELHKSKEGSYITRKLRQNTG